MTELRASMETIRKTAGMIIDGIETEMKKQLGLQQEKPILMLVMVYGGLNAINIFTYYMIALTRSQKWLLIGYAAAALTVFILAPVMVRQYEMTGAILSSIISIFLLDAILAAILIIVIRNRLRGKV